MHTSFYNLWQTPADAVRCVPKEEEALMKDPILYRRRLIPEECVLLKDDRILLHEDNILVTSWQALKPRKDLHHGFSCYFFEEGYKISKFYAADNTLLYYYCDIITHSYDEESNTLVVTDLLADVIIYPDGFVKVVDLGEISQALTEGLITIPQLQAALLSLDALLNRIYAGKLGELTAPINRFDPAESLLHQC